MAELLVETPQSRHELTSNLHQEIENEMQNKSSALNITLTTHNNTHKQTSNITTSLSGTISQSTLSLISSEIQTIAKSFNKLSFQFYKIYMTNVRKNLLFSPYSLANLINICFFCSDEFTKNEAAKVLNFLQNSEDNNNEYVLDFDTLRESSALLANVLNKLANGINTNSNINDCSSHTRKEQLLASNSSSTLNQSIHTAKSTITSSRNPFENSFNSGFNFILNNTSFTQSDFLLENYRQTLKDVFFSDIVYDDFKELNNEEDRDNLADRINMKMRKMTHGNIVEIIKTENLNQDIFMILLNTLHLEAKWKFNFDSKVETGVFRVNNDHDIEVTLLRMPDIRLMYANKPNDLPCKLCEFPFINDSFVLTILLPDSNKINEIEEMLTHEFFDELINKLVNKRVNVVLPKFQFHDEFDINEIFHMLGASSLIDFKEAATGLCINRSMYKSYMNLTEKGVEASACSAFTLTHDKVYYENDYTSHPSDEFNCDKPFLFFLRERYTKTILFMGKLMVPE